MTPPKAILLDLDGVLHVSSYPIAGAVEALAFLRRRGIPFRIVTNTSTRSRISLARQVVEMGLPLSADEIISAAHAGVLYLRSRGCPSCRLVMAEDAKSDFAEFPQDTDSPDVVVIGDHDDWNYPLLNELFNQVQAGAEIVALHKGRYWQVEDGLRVDIGLFVAGLEYVTDKSATIVGKPSPAFFHMALTDLRMEPGNALMIGDDIVNDVGGAQQAGLRGVLVRTGKYRPGYETSAGVTPDAVIDSIANLPALFNV